MSIPSREQIEEYVVAVEEYVSSSFQSVAPDIPAISDAIHRLWVDLSRFGPPEMPDIAFPGLGGFEVPTPPPPPPPPPMPQNTWCEDVANWASRHRLAMSACVLGLTFATAYGATVFAQNRSRAKMVTKTIGTGPHARRLVVGETAISSLPCIKGLLTAY